MLLFIGIQNSSNKSKVNLLIDETINSCCEAVNFFLNHNINETMNKYNQKNKGIK